MTSSDEIIAYLFQNYEGKTPPSHPTSGFWSLADLFIRQYLNNGCDGFGCKNINVVYDYLYKNKDDLIKFNLISKDGYNNSGYPLWKNYSFGKPKSKEIEALCESHNQDILDAIAEGIRLHQERVCANACAECEGDIRKVYSCGHFECEKTTRQMAQRHGGGVCWCINCGCKEKVI